MVKVGDRVKLVKQYGGWHSDNLGKEGIVIGKRISDYVVVLFDHHEAHEYEEDWGNPNHLELISTTPTYTIPADTETVILKYADGSTQDIDVKDRARGIPEWVKDGAWVVRKDSGKISRLVEIGIGFSMDSGELYPIACHKEEIARIFRPFTNSDWKWGMWAEYEGEKVFVNKAIDDGVTAYKPTNPYFFIPFDKITPTTAP